MLIVEVPVKPVGKARPRFVKKTGMAYNPQATEEGEILLHCMREWGDRPPIAGPFKIECQFIFARPKSHLGTGANSGKLRPSAPACHTSKPDIDNILKIILDSLQGVIFTDDKNCIACSCVKRYARETDFRGRYPAVHEWNRAKVILKIEEATEDDY